VRVMQVHNRYRSSAPSGENRVVDTEAAALESAGHEVIRFERSSDEIEQWSIVKKASLPARIFWSREVHRDITAMLRDHRPDVVHVHNTFPLLSPAVLFACRDAKVPVVVTIHNKRLVCASGDFFRRGGVCHDCVDGPPVQAIVHGCYRGSRIATTSVVVATAAHRRAWQSLVSAYIFISASQRDLLAGLGFAPERVFVRHHLIPRRNVPPATGQRALVLCVGRLDEAKGLRLLMTAWDRYQMRSPDPGLRLGIVGGGALEREVATWSASRPSVDLFGRIDDDRRLAELMSSARAVLLPSTIEETFGLVAVEAMSLGVPSVAASHGALVELITAGVDGELFQPGDPEALALAIADVDHYPERYAAYGAVARKTYEQRFDPEQTLERLLEVYRFAVAHPI
jgi:glycosyltransferase involved in cell wall biosynthesis